MNRPYKNPNRWMINHVPVMMEKPRLDYWAIAIGMFTVVGACVWFAWALTMI